MVTYTKEQVQQLVICALFSPAVLASDEADRLSTQEIWDIVANLDFPDMAYKPDDVLINRIKDYNQWCVTRQGENPGELMEELAFLAFRCLKGVESTKSFQSYASQHDLVVYGGRSIMWWALMFYLHLPFEGRNVLVEAKNESTKLSDKQMSRLCSIMEHKYTATCHLGVFFTRLGATGFPESGSVNQDNVRRSALRYARATQILFHAMTKEKFVVVLDHNDLQQLAEVGGFPKLLEWKIRDVEDASGLPLQFDDNGKEVDDLPPHLSKYVP